MLFIFWVICGVFACVVAGNKGHNGCMWALGGFLLGPLALLATLGLGDRKAQRRQDDLLEETRRQNEWMRRKMYEAEEERQYFEEQRYRQRMRRLPPEEYYDDEEYGEDRENDEYIDVAAIDKGDGELNDNQEKDDAKPNPDIY
jgi:hypothetical protein